MHAYLPNISLLKLQVSKQPLETCKINWMFLLTLPPQTYKVELGNVGNYGHLMPMICDCCCSCCCCYKNICFSSCFSIITHTSNLWQSPGGCYWIILLFFLFFFVLLSPHTAGNQMQMFIMLHCTPSALVHAQRFMCSFTFHPPLSICISHSLFAIHHFPICPPVPLTPIHNQVARNLHMQRLQKFGVGLSKLHSILRVSNVGEAY